MFFHCGYILKLNYTQLRENHEHILFRYSDRWHENRQLLPNKFPIHTNVDRKQFLAAVERIAVLADQKNNILKCSIDSVNQEISLSVDAQDVGSGRESMAAQISADEPEEIPFNVKYL